MLLLLVLYFIVNLLLFLLFCCSLVIVLVIAVVVVELEVGTLCASHCVKEAERLDTFFGCDRCGKQLMNNSECHVSFREVSVKKRVLTGYFPVYSD
jgi:hypothetical protein